jgi:hypothetical protein
MPKGLIVSLHGHFYSVLFVVTLDFFICLVYVAGFVVSDPSALTVADADQPSQIFVLSYLSHPYPLALTVALSSS